MSKRPARPGGQGDRQSHNAASPLRVGVILESLLVPVWLRTILEELVAAPYVDIVLLVEEAPASPLERTPPGSILWRWYEDWDHRRYSGDDDPFRRVDVAPSVSGITTLTLRSGGAHRFDAATTAAIAAADLDVLIDFGCGDLPDGVVSSARYGIWSLHHGHEGCARECPPLFEEISARKETSTTSLQALSADGIRVIFRSHGSTNVHSLYLTRKANYWKAATFIPRRLKHLHQFGWEHLTSLHPGEPVADDGAGCRSPGNAEMASFLVRLGVRLALRRVRSRAVEEAWFIAYRPRQTGRRTDGIPRDMTGFREIVAPPGGEFADPFVFELDGRHYIFFEQLRPKSGKGVISYMELDHSGRCSVPQLALEREYHLSYPYVFALDGEVYMVPETSARRTVELYRAQPFPSRWVLERVLLEDRVAVDSTLVCREGRFWMFLAEQVGGGTTHDELSLYYAESLLGPWLPHALNPIVSDVRFARPAGRPFESGDGVTLIRPAQDCARRYGRAIVFMKIERLTPTDYRETEVGRIEPDWRRALVATHTYTRDSRFEVVDGCSQRPGIASAMIRGWQRRRVAAGVRSVG